MISAFHHFSYIILTKNIYTKDNNPYITMSSLIWMFDFRAENRFMESLQPTDSNELPIA
jgi:hypothetical protein